MTRVLIVPGRGGSGENHWQTHLERLLPDAKRVEQLDWEQPELRAWATQFDRVARSCAIPPLVVAHSFGCLAVAYAAITYATPIGNSLLVAPADPQRFGIADTVVMHPLDHPSEVLASTNDPWLCEARVRLLALAWGSRLEVLGPLGHINVDSGHGEWPDILRRIEMIRAEA